MRIHGGHVATFVRAVRRLSLKTLSGILCGFVMVSSVPRSSAQTCDSFDAGPNRGMVQALCQQPDGKFLVALDDRQRLVRFNADGTVDPSFQYTPVPLVPGTIYCLGMATDGGILVGGNYPLSPVGLSDSCLGRLNADGTLDTTFDPAADMFINSVCVQLDGRILVGGHFYGIGHTFQSFLARLNPGGALDASFAPKLNWVVQTLAAQSDGRILVSGLFSTVNGVSCTNLARLNPNGTWDSAFQPSVGGPVYAMAPQADGKIVVGGRLTSLNGQPRGHLGRLNSDGTLDTGFDAGTDGTVYALVTETDGKILVGGAFSNLVGQACRNIGRLKADGTFDSSFAPEANDAVYSLALQSDGKVLVGGAFTEIGGQTRSNVARLCNTDAATQDLSFNTSSITWLLGGTSPEFWSVTFEGSTNGEDWVSLGPGARIAGGWRLDGLALQPNSTVLARGSAAGSYYYGSSWFLETAMGPPAVAVPPSSRTASATSTTTFRVVAKGAGPLSYQWLKGGNDLADGANIFGAKTPALTLSNLLGVDAGAYSVRVSNAVGVVTSKVAVLTVLDPMILSQPASQSANAGQVVTLIAGAAGTSPFGFQWFKDGIALTDGARISGATNSILSMNGVLGADAGGYAIVITNVWGSVTSAVALLTVADPILTVQPSGASVKAGQTVGLQVSAAGTPPLDFQWLKNGAPLVDGGRVSGARSSALALSDVLGSDAGGYSVVVSNLWSRMTSAVAVVSVADPAIAVQPVSQGVILGQAFQLSVTAAGTPPLQYRWFKDGNALAGAADASLAFASSQAADAGDYVVVVVSSFGRITSDVAVVRIALPPVVQTLNPAGHSGTAATLQGTVNPKGLPTTAWFEWGTSTAYGESTPIRNLDPSFSDLLLTNLLTNLTPGGEYHYRISASNSLGTSVGGDIAFLALGFSNSFAGYPLVGRGFVAWGDYDRNGDLDLLAVSGPATNAQTFLYRNQSGLFAPVWPIYGLNSAGLPSLEPGSATWGDYDNDGNLDLLLTGRSYSWWWWTFGPPNPVFRNDNGALTNAVAGILQVGRGCGAWADYDDDGRLDFILIGDTNIYYYWNTGPSPTNLLYHSNGDGTFTDVHAGLPPLLDSSVDWGDYDNDGLPDLLIAGDTGGGCVTRIYHNDGGGQFSDIGADLAGVASGSVAWGDFDGDGWLDIVVAGSTNNSPGGAVCRIYRNNHDSTFSDVAAVLPGIYQGAAAWGDYDNDGQLDLLLTGISSSFGAPAARIYRNRQGVFADIGAGLADYTSGSGAWGDYDNDGRLDVALTGSGSDSWGSAPLLYRNLLGVTNLAPNRPAPPGGLSADVLNNGVTLRWSASTDPHTPAPGLTYNVRVGKLSGGGDVLPPESDLVTGQRRVPHTGNAEHRLFSVLTNLAVGQYYWSVQAINHSFAGSPWGVERTFAVTSGPPVAATLPASNVLCCSADLKGTVIPGGIPTVGWFEWGTSANLGNATPPIDLSTGLQPQLVTQSLSDLEPLTTYFFRCVASNTAGVCFGTNTTFKTEVPAPQTATLGATNIGAETVTLLGAALSPSPPAEYFFEWGLTPAYGHLSEGAILDSAIGLDGMNDAVEVGWGRFAQITNNFTIELWAKPTAARAETLETATSSAGLSGQRYAIFPEQGAIAYGNAANSGAGISIGTNGVSVAEHTDNYLATVLVYTGSLSGWTHVAVVYTQHQPLLYLNGSLVRAGLVSDKNVHPSAGLGGTTNYANGSHFEYGWFAGALQEVRLWDIPLDADTLRLWMNQELTSAHPAYAHLQGHWSLKDGRGSAAIDDSPSRNSSQLLNGAYWTAGRTAGTANFGAALAGLADGMTYHFRAFAKNPGGTAYGEDFTFTTLQLPRLLTPVLQPGPWAMLRFSGATQTMYSLEVSSNLVDWVLLTNLSSGPDGRFDFLDTSGSDCPARFYRLRVP